MNKPKLSIIIGFIIVFIIGILVGILIDFDKTKVISDTTNQDSANLITSDGYQIDYQSIRLSRTFYATIKDIREYNGYTNVLVSGLDINDINYRSEFYFSIKETTDIIWQNVKIDKSELEVGDTVSITFTGGVLESYPGQIQNVVEINLLDDEK